MGTEFKISDILFNFRLPRRNGNLWLGLIGYGVWAALQIQSWWVPWIFGANERALRNQQFLHRTFKIFPSSTSHPAPDGMHFVLDLLLFFVVVTALIGLLCRSRDERPAVQARQRRKSLRPGMILHAWSDIYAGYSFQFMRL
jgi:hypothetical protein